MINKERAKQVAIEEIEKRIVTREQAKARYKKWILSALKGNTSLDVLDFWNEVIIQIDKN